MPFDGSGNFTRSYNFVQDKNNGIKIVASRVDGEFDNFATAMNQVMMRNGITPLTGNLNMGTNTINSLGNGTVGTPAIRFNSDPTTGIFAPAYGQVSLAAGGVERVQANATGAQIFGALNTTGAATIGGALNANAGAAVTGALSATGNLSVSGSATIGAGATITGALTTTGVVNPSNLANWYIGLNGVTPLINFDANDFYQYDKTNNQHQFIVASAEYFRVGAGYSKVFGQSRFGDDSFMAYLSGGVPVVQMDSNDWIDYDRSTNNYRMIVGASSRFEVNSSRTLINGQAQFGDTNYAMYMSGGNPILNFDANDHMYFDRALNRYHLMTGSLAKFVVDPLYTQLYGQTRFASDGSFYADMSGGNPILNFDANDYYAYDRAGNAYSWYINSAQKAYINSSGIVSNGSIFAAGGGVVSRTGMDGTNGGLQMVAASGAAATGYLGFYKADGVTRQAFIGNISTSAGAQDMTYNNDSGGKHVFGQEVRASVLSTDPNFQLYLLSGVNPIINFDSFDYLRYDRSSNLYEYIINGTQRFRIQSDGNVVAQAGVYDNGGINVRASGDLSAAQYYIDTLMQNGQTHRRTGGSIALGSDSSSVVTITNAFSTILNAGIGSATTVNANEDACFVNIISGSQIRVVNGATAQTLGWWAEGIV